MRVLLDTNMLLDAVKFHVDVLAEAQKFGEPFTLNSCVSELERMAKGGGEEALQSRIALSLVKKLPVDKTDEKGDRAILTYAVRHSCAVATNDKNLIKALQPKGIRVIRLRQKRYLIEG